MDHFQLCLKVKNTNQKKKNQQNPNNRQPPCAFLKTDSKSVEVLFCANEVKTAFSPQHYPNLNSLKGSSCDSENVVALCMNITSCNKNSTSFILICKSILWFKKKPNQKKPKKTNCAKQILSHVLPSIKLQLWDC